LRFLPPPRCERCGASTAWPVERCRECVGRKEHGLRRVATVAADLVVTHVERPAADVITYIPPDPARQLQRGHHPAERLAHELGVRWSLENTQLLARRRSGRRQTGLDRTERQANVRGTFAASGPVVGAVVLVDDVYTTGATVAAAAAALRAAGASDVRVVTFARTVR
jgi:predicted amidophosphoribosyltransferase